MASIFAVGNDAAEGDDSNVNPPLMAGTSSVMNINSNNNNGRSISTSSQSKPAYHRLPSSSSSTAGKVTTARSKGTSTISPPQSDSEKSNTPQQQRRVYRTNSTIQKVSRTTALDEFGRRPKRGQQQHHEQHQKRRQQQQQRKQKQQQQERWKVQLAELKQRVEEARNHPKLMEAHMAADEEEVDDDHEPFRHALLTQAYCDSVMATCVASNAWDAVIDVMDLILSLEEEEGSTGLTTQGRSTYRACLQSCFEVGNGPTAMDILEAMQRAGVTPNGMDVSLVVATLCRGDYYNHYTNNHEEQETENEEAAVDGQESKTSAGSKRRSRQHRGAIVSKADWSKAMNLLRIAPMEIFNRPSMVPFGENMIPVEAYEAVLSCISMDRSSGSSGATEQTTSTGNPKGRQYYSSPSKTGYNAKESFQNQNHPNAAPNTNWKDALQILHWMEQGYSVYRTEYRQHPLPTLAAYRLVIETCLHGNQSEQAFQVLQSMTKAQQQQQKVTAATVMTPTAYMFDLVIAALAQKSQWRRAIQLLDTMEELAIPKTVETYNRVIAACSKAGEVGMATNLLSRMRSQSSIRPDIVSFNSVIAACASDHFRWKQALQLLDQVHREPGVTADIITYTNAIRACTKGGNTKRALRLWQVVKDKKLPLDSYIYSAVMDACAKGGMWEKSLELLQELKDISSSNSTTDRNPSLKPNAFIYSVCISACGNGGQWKTALSLLDEMRHQGMRLTLYAYNSVITALSKASRNNARNSAKERSLSKYASDGSTHSGEQDPDGHDVTSRRASGTTHSENSSDGGIDEDELWKRALILLDQMEEDRIEPDGFSYSAAISCCGSGGRWEEALELMDRMKRGGPRTRPNKIAYTAAISACGRSGQHEQALKLFDDMKQQGLHPDRVTYNSVFLALRIGKEVDKTMELWNEICGKRSVLDSGKAGSNSGRGIAAVGLDSSLKPDIITVTEVIATLTRSSSNENDAECTNNDDKVDLVFVDAVERGLIFGKGGLDSKWEVDLSGMSFPVARAACRFVVHRALKDFQNEDREDKSKHQGEGSSKSSTTIEDITFITGVGHNITSPTTKLRDYVRDCLQTDFTPPIDAVIPQRAKGTVCIPKETLVEWMDKQA